MESDEEIAAQIRRTMQELAETLGIDAVEVKGLEIQHAHSEEKVARQTQRAILMAMISRLGGAVTMHEDEAKNAHEMYDLHHRYDSGTNAVTMYLKLKAKTS